MVAEDLVHRILLLTLVPNGRSMLLVEECARVSTQKRVVDISSLFHTTHVLSDSAGQRWLWADLVGSPAVI